MKAVDASTGMRCLIACESSGRVRDEFRRLGASAVSCDLLPTEVPGPHYQGDVREILGGLDGAPWDLMVAHPDCTYLCVSGLHWNTHKPGRTEKIDPAIRQGYTEAALEFVKLLLEAPIPRIALENPVGIIPTRLGIPASQYIQPYEYGDDASKKTALFLKGLPLLSPTKFIEPRYIDGRPRWSNQTDSGQNRLAPGPNRWRDRSRTYLGIARAMAEQWVAPAPSRQIELILD